MAWSSLLGLCCVAHPVGVLASTGFNGACKGISQDISSGKLLATDESGKVFSGTFQDPLKDMLATAGNVDQARYVLGGSRILLVYHSGAVELLDASNPSSVLARLPASSYVAVNVSGDGRWAVAVLPGRASVDVLEFSPSTIKAVWRYDHPLFAVFTKATIASELPVVALFDEKFSLHLVNWKTGQLFPTPEGWAGHKLLKLEFIFDDLLWASMDTGLIPMGSVSDIAGKERSLEVEGKGMSLTFGKAQLIAFGQGQTVLALDDLGFTDILQRTAQGSRSIYAGQGSKILSPGLHEAVADRASDLAALCGASLEIVSLPSGARVMVVPTQPRSTVFVDNVTADGELALVRDIQGRAAIWSLPQARYLSMLPRLQLQVFPAWASINAVTKTYLAFGQTDVLTVARPVKGGGTGSEPYAVAAVPLNFQLQQGQDWDSSAIFAPDNHYKAYVVRPEMISTVTWSKFAVYVPPTQIEFIRADASASQCAAYSSRMAVSDNGSLLAVACIDGIAVYNTKTKRRVAFIKSPQWTQASARVKVWVSSLAFSPGAKRLAFAVRVQQMYIDPTADNALSANAPTVYVYDFRPTALKTIRTSGQVPVTAVAFSPNGNQLWVGGRWGDLVVYGVDRGDFLWRQRGITGSVFGIAFDKRGDAAVWTDAGLLSLVRLYDRTVSSTWFLTGGRTSGDGLRLSSHTPNRLQLASNLPSDVLANPRQKAVLNLFLKVPSEFQDPLQSLLYVDGDAVASGKLVEPVKNGVMHLAFPTQGLRQGSLSVGLFSQEGGASALSLGEITAQSGTESTGKLIGVFVGIGKYQDPALAPLPLAGGDAHAVAASLKQDGAQLHVFPHDTPTRDELISLLVSARDTARPEDTLMLFISGHALTTPDNRFLIPAADTLLSETSGPHSGISPDELLKVISEGRQGDTVLILDTCESSAFISALMKHPLLSDGPLSLGGGEGRGLTNNISVLAAAATLQAAKEGYGGRGLLAGVVIDGLKGEADGNRDEKITQRELMNYVDRLMVTISRKAFPTQPQEPVLHYGTADVDLLKVRIH